MAKNAKLILFGILIIALFSRTFKLTSIPPSLNQDEAVNGYDAFTLGINLKDHHGNFLPPMLESFGDWASPLITYLTIPFVKIFDLSLFSVRIPVALLGTASVYLMFLFLHHIFKKTNIALLGAFLLAISPWHISQSRWAIPPGIVPFFLLLTLCTFFWALNKQKKDASIWQYIIPGTIGGLLTYSYPTMKLFAPIFILILALIYLKNKFASLLILLTAFAVLVSPIYILTISDPKYNARFAGVSGLNDKKEVITRYFDYFLPHFQFQTGDPDFMHQVPGIGNSYLFLSVFFYLGIIICLLGQFKIIVIKDIDHKTYSLLLAWLFLFPLAASLTRDRNMLLRVIHGLPLVVIFSALAFVFLFKYFKKMSSLIFILIILLFGIFSFTKFMKFYFTKYPDLVFRQYQYGIDQYSKFLLKNEAKFDKVIIDSNINQPYIYYLFYSSFNPSKLNYKDPRLSNPKYVFDTVSQGVVENLPSIFRVEYKDNLRFIVYTKDSTWYVKQY
jgi:hypothetical protein